MSVEVKLTAVKSLSNTSTTAIVEVSNLNFQSIVSAMKEFLASINYEQGSSEVFVDITSVSADWVQARNGVKVYGSQLLDGSFPTVIELHPTGLAEAQSLYAQDVASALRMRLRVLGALPPVGIPGEMVYIEAQGNYVEGIYAWFNSTGWTLLAGTGGGVQPCTQGVVMSAVANAGVTGTDGLVASDSLFLVPAPLPSTSFVLYVNGLETQIGDAVKTLSAYFSKDGGATASALRSVDSTDALYWNYSIAKYGLESYDTLTLQYDTVDPFCSQSGYSCITMVDSGPNLVFPQFNVEIVDAPSQTGPMTVCHLPNPTTSDGFTLATGYYLENSIDTFSISDPNGIFPSGAVVKFTLPQSISMSDFNLVRIYHEVGNALVDETILAGPYAPDYPNRWIYAQATSFSPFYVIQGVLTTTTTTSTTTTTINPCPANNISFTIPFGNNPTSITFDGTPVGPMYVVFTDQLGGVHDLTGLLGSQVSLPWTFDLTDLPYMGIPTIVGVYTFQYDVTCFYTVQVSIEDIPGTTTTTTLAPGVSTTTTTTQTPTTTTTSSTTTTTILPTTTTTTSGVTYYIPDPYNPTSVQFSGSPTGPFDIVFTDELLNQYYIQIYTELHALPWTFDITLAAYQTAGIFSIIGTYEFYVSDVLIFSVTIPNTAVSTTTSTTSP